MRLTLHFRGINGGKVQRQLSKNHPFRFGSIKIYSRVSTRSLGKIRSPLDSFDIEGCDVDTI